MDKEALARIPQFLQKAVDDKVIPAGYSICSHKNGERHDYYAGYRDFNNPGKGLMDGDINLVKFLIFPEFNAIWWVRDDDSILLIDP